MSAVPAKDFERAIQELVEERYKLLRRPMVTLQLRGLVEHDELGLLLVPLKPIHTQQAFPPVEAIPCPPVFVRPTGASLLLDFAAGGDSWLWVEDEVIWQATLDYVRRARAGVGGVLGLGDLSGHGPKGRTGFSTSLNALQHFVQLIAILVAARSGVKLGRHDLPSVDPQALADALEAARARRDGVRAAERERQLAAMTPAPKKYDPAADAAQVEAARELRDALAASDPTNKRRPSRR